MENINSLAKDWIYELLEERRKLIHKCINYRTIENNWKGMMELTIAETAWKVNYRKVSQLCYTIEGDILNLFKSHFPKETEYKHLIPPKQINHCSDPIKVGDRVIIVHSEFNTPIGAIGTVRAIKHMDCYNNIEVLFDIDKCNNNYIGCDGETWVADFNLEKI